MRSAPGRETLTSDLSEGDGLPYRQKSLFESSLGRNLAGVRVHTDDASAAQADQHNARAYAVGNDIMFARGQYNPGTPEGDQLLAHEVAHTQQQQGAAPTENVRTTSPGDGAETNADAAAVAMTQGAPAQVSSEPLAIARKRADETVEVPADTAPVPADTAPQDVAAPAADTKAKSGDGPIGDLAVERVGAEEDEGSEPVGPPQNLEGGKAELASKAAGLPADGGAEELQAGAPKVEGIGGGGGGGGDIQLSEELKGTIGAAQADAHEATEAAKADANAYKSEIKERRDRFDDQQQALSLEQLKTMSAADKRSTLIEMGYDAKAVKKMKDAELAGIISGKLDSEARKTKILGMDPDELKALSPGQKQQFLVDLGVDKQDLDKIGPQKSAQAFDDVMRVAHIPGQHKVKVKIKGGLLGKSWEINVKVDAQGAADFEAKKKGGFFSKLWGWVKSALPVILTVLAPLTGGATLIVLAVYQTVTAIASGDWLGAIVGAAGAVVGVGALAGIAKSASAGAKAFKQIADVAGKVKNVAVAAKAAMVAAKAKSPGSLLAALASGASSFADFAASSADKFQATMTRWSEKLDKWSKVISGGEKVAAGIKAGDPGAAIGGAFDTAAAFASSKNAKGEETSGTAKNLQKYSRLAGYASAGQRAANGKPPNYGAVVDAAMGIAGELKDSRKLDDATRITGAASRLTRAIQTNDPAQLAEAAVSLAEAIQLAKYDSDHPEQKSADGKTAPDEDREKIQARYRAASSAVKFASAAITAASAKPRPNYIAALDAATNLIAELTDGKKLDQAARITSALDTWTNAVRSKDEMAIIRAGEAFGNAINGMVDVIKEDRAAARKAAEAKLAPGETLADDGGDIPRFEASVDVVGQTDVVPLQGPGIITTLSEPVAEVSTSEEFRIGLGPRDNTPGANYTVISGDTLSGIASRFKVNVSFLQQGNPQLADSKIYVGQRLYVPGADVLLTPSVTTTVGDVHVAPGNTPVVDTAIISARTDLRPVYLDGVIDAAEALAAISGSEIAKTTIDLVKAIRAAEVKLDKAGRSDLDAYKSMVANLKVLVEGADFARTAQETLADQLKPYLREGLEMSPSTFQGVRNIQTYLGRLTRAARIPVTLIGLVDDLSTMLDSSKAATERASAAHSVVRLVGSGALAKDFYWVTGFARNVAENVGNHYAYAAVSMVRNAARRVGDVGEALADVMGKWSEPIFKKVSAETGEKLAREWVEKIAFWAAERQSGRIVSSVANRALTQLIGRGLRQLALGPVGLALDVVQLEAEFIAYLDREVRYGTTTFFSQLLFGKMVNTLKTDVRARPTAPMASAEDTVRYFYGEMLGGARSDVKQGWPAFAQRYLLEQRKWYAVNAATAQALLSSARPYDSLMLTIEIARVLQTGALRYIDEQFRKEFKQEPPG